jgi:flagellar basal-body rod modification protein FlgD
MTTVPGATANAASAPTNQADVSRLNQGFDDFLKLLTTQLQNQDPLSPMDTSEFTNQLVMFSQVEQQLRSNDTLNKLLTMQTLNMTALGVSFIGKDVQIAGDTFANAGGQPANFAYTLPATAKAGTISITDQAGNIVYTKAIDTSMGTHDFTWNGITDGGLPAPAGEYKLIVSAQDATDAALNVTTYVPGHVSGLQTADDGTLMLNVNGQTIPMTSVRQVSEHGA